MAKLAINEISTYRWSFEEDVQRYAAVPDPASFGGRVWEDADGDDYGAVASGGTDCNDNDADVHPGVTAWFDAPSNGSYDYNCDKQEEPRWPDKVNCQIVAGKSVGDGWSGAAAVPACGVNGMLTTCVKKGSKCQEDTTTQTKQECR